MVTVLPDGWVFLEAENASGFAKGSTARIAWVAVGS